MKRPISRASLLALGLAALAPRALADDAPAAPPPPPPTSTVSGHIEFGIAGNPDDPSNLQNFGQTFTDHSNQVQLNQLMITFEKKLDPNATGWDFGYRVQPMVGTDARYTHFLGELDTDIKDRTQLDIVEAKLLIHAPILTEGGVDITIGQYATPIGAEVIDATGNIFYSHSYNFEFGNPFKHTGGYAVIHLDPTWDVYLGGDTGVNTSLGDGDNNHSPAFLGGFGLNNLLDGKLTVLVLTHIGPENADLNDAPQLDNYLRYINDAVITYKASDALTLTAELQYVHDELVPADAWGVTGYAAYTLSDTLTIAGRAEIFQDHNGFYVGAYPGNLDAVYVQKGQSSTAYFSPGTYGELTFGITYKPAIDNILGFSGIAFRPEVRFDHDFDDHRQYDATSSQPYGSKSDQVTLAADVTLSF